MAVMPRRDARLAPFTHLKRLAWRPDDIAAGLGRFPDVDFKPAHHGTNKSVRGANGYNDARPRFLRHTD